MSAKDLSVKADAQVALEAVKQEAEKWMANMSSLISKRSSSEQRLNKSISVLQNRLSNANKQVDKYLEVKSYPTGLFTFNMMQRCLADEYIQLYLYLLS